MPASEVDGTRFGRAVHALSDIDDDGVQELAIAAPVAQEERGCVLVLSGANQDVLQVWHGDPDLQGFGHTLRDAGDVDGDGRGDVLVGYEIGARTEVRSGANGALLAAFDRASHEVHAFGDLDRDGRADLLLTRGNRWEIRAGPAGSKLTGSSFVGAGPYFSVGDLNCDGLSDGVLAGSGAYLCKTSGDGQGDPKTSYPMPTELQTPLRETWREPLEPSSRFLALRASAAGDIDGDGRMEVLLTLLARSDPSTRYGRPARLFVLSPTLADSAIWSVEQPAPLGGADVDCIGYSTTAPGDLDGDGRADIVIADGIDFFHAAICAYSLAKGERLWQYKAPIQSCPCLTGLALATADDRDHDGVRDVLVGSSDWCWHGSVCCGGRVTLVSGATGEPIWSIGEERYDEVLHFVAAPK